MSVEFDVELFLFTLSQSLAEMPNVRCAFETYYQTDKYRFYERANRSKYYNTHIMSNQTLEYEVAKRRIFGILLCAEDDESVHKFVYPRILNIKPRYRDIMKQPSSKATNQLMQEGLKANRSAKSIHSLNANKLIICYLLYAKHGTNSGKESVDKFFISFQEYFSTLWENRQEITDYKKAFGETDINVIPKEALSIIRRISSCLDFMYFEKDVEDQFDFKPEFQKQLINYAAINYDNAQDFIKSLNISSMINTVMFIKGVSLFEMFGHIKLSTEEQKVILYHLANRYSSLNSNNEDSDDDENESENELDEIFKQVGFVSEFLVGFIVTILVNEIQNMKEFYFKNNSETQYFELNRLEVIVSEKDREIERLKDELIRANKTNEQQKEEIHKLTDEAYRDNRGAIKPYASEISDLSHKIKELNNALSEEKEKTLELNALREFVFSLQTQTEFIPDDNIANLTDLLNEKKVIVVGGHINWRNKLKQQYPAIDCVDGHNKSINTAVFENADIILFNVSNMAHAVYEKIVNSIKSRNLKIGYLGRTSNITLLESEIASILQRMQE